jgi:hypothetical protein
MRKRLPRFFDEATLPPSRKMRLWAADSCLVGDGYYFTVRISTWRHSADLFFDPHTYTSTHYKPRNSSQSARIQLIAANHSHPLDPLTTNGVGFAQIWAANLAHPPSQQKPTLPNPLLLRLPQAAVVLRRRVRRPCPPGRSPWRHWLPQLPLWLEFWDSAGKMSASTNSEVVLPVAWTCFPISLIGR